MAISAGLQPSISAGLDSEFPVHGNRVFAEPQQGTSIGVQGSWGRLAGMYQFRPGQSESAARLPCRRMTLAATRSPSEAAPREAIEGVIQLRTVLRITAGFGMQKHDGAITFLTEDLQLQFDVTGPVRPVGGIDLFDLR